MESPIPSADKSSLHFLTLPREIRDTIYGYLTHDVVLDTTFEGEFRGATGHRYFADIVNLELPRCPVHAVLLVHPQIYAEYTASSAFSNLHAILHVATDGVHFSEDYDARVVTAFRPPKHIEEKNQRRLKATIAQFQHFTLRVAFSRGHPVDMMPELMRIVTSHLNRIKTIRIEFLEYYPDSIGQVSAYTDDKLSEVLGMQLARLEIRHVKPGLMQAHRTNRVRLVWEPDQKCVHYHYVKNSTVA